MMETLRPMLAANMMMETRVEMMDMIAAGTAVPVTIVKGKSL